MIRVRYAVLGIFAGGLVLFTTSITDADTVLVDAGDGVVTVPADVMGAENAMTTDAPALVVSTGAIPFTSSETIVLGVHTIENDGVDSADLLASRSAAVDDIVSPRELAEIEARNDAAVADALRTTLRGYVNVVPDGAARRQRSIRRGQRSGGGGDGGIVVDVIGLDADSLLADFIDAEFIRQLLPGSGADARGRASFSVLGIGEFVLERTADGGAMKLTETTTGLSYNQEERRAPVVRSEASAVRDDNKAPPRRSVVANKRSMADLLGEIAKAVVASPWSYAALFVFLVAMVFRRGRPRAAD